MEATATSKLPTFAILPILLASLVSSAALSFTALSLVSPIKGAATDPVNRHKVMAVTVCGAIPLVAAYFKFGKNKKFKEGDGSTRDAVQGEKGEDGSKSRTSILSSISDNLASNTSLVRKHTFTVPVNTGEFSYSSIRVFHRLHSKASKLGRSLPLLVFLHGLGGQLSQFQFMLEYFVHISHILAIDLPGCGGSEFAPRDWKAYTTASLTNLIAIIVRQHLEEGQQVVLIGHSMGCGLAAALAARNGLLVDVCAGLVAICPKAEVTESERKRLSSAVRLGDIGFDIYRLYDRWGGVNSQSVTRYIGANASDKVRKMQLNFNKQSRTPVWRRMVAGMELPSKEQWTSISCPIYLIAGAEDKVCLEAELDKLYDWLTNQPKVPSDRTSVETAVQGRGVVKRCVIPNAGHSVIYESHHIVNGLVNDFLAHHVDEVLSLSWQLNFLKEDKWLLKNLEKWMRIQAVSPRIGRSPFRAMKTLRQNDEEHSPPLLAAKYSDIAHVIDISHEQPPYDPTSFGPSIQYHKFATVSKIPPTPEEVAAFIALVDSILAIPDSRPLEQRLIACHCHYGFNRTGFFLCSYMIEKLDYDVPEALAKFKRARPPGIRHPHFITELFERYDCPGLRRPSLS